MTEIHPPLRVLIAGAGIGGLATAISLARVSGISNLDIQLYEQAPELREIGASIALSPNVCFSYTLHYSMPVEAINDKDLPLTTGTGHAYTGTSWCA